MSSLTGKEIQIVNALSSADLPEKIIGESCVKELISAVVNAQVEANNAASRLEAARYVKNNSNAISNWWNNTEDSVKDAQLRLSTTVANLNRHSSQLLIFNTAISKVLCDQQDVLLRQQRILEEQAEQLKQQNLGILTQQKALEEQQIEIAKANQGLLEAKGVSAEQARNLIGCVQRVEAAEERISQLHSSLLSSIDARLEQAVSDVNSSFAPTVTGLEERDKQLLKLIQDQQRKLADSSAALASSEQRISRQEKALPAAVTNLEAGMAPVSEALMALQGQYANLKTRVVLGGVSLAVGVLLCAGLAGYALLPG
jgi:DNA repair exonuclease SbcCD ATPase subunit